MKNVQENPVLEATKAPKTATTTRTIIHHRVADPGKWTGVFNSAFDLRKRLGETSAAVGTFMQDPAVVCVLNEWNSPEAFRALLANPEIKADMQQGGVLETPHAYTLKSAERSAFQGGKVLTLVIHRVADFKNWKAVFDGVRDLRKKDGELSYDAGIFAEDPGVVYVLNEWDSADRFRAHLANPEVKNAMMKGGVMEAPTTIVFN